MKRSNFKVINDSNSILIGGSMTLENALKMIKLKDLSETCYQSIISNFNHNSRFKIFLLNVSSLGKIKSIYPQIDEADKFRSKDTVRFILVTSDNKKSTPGIYAFEPELSVSLVFRKIEEGMKGLIEESLETDNSILVGNDYYVFDGKKVIDRVTVTKISEKDKAGSKIYLVESIINPGMKYHVEGFNLISESSFNSMNDTSKYIYPSGDSHQQNSENKMDIRDTLSRKEMERQMDIGIVERINSKFDKLSTIIENVDSLFSKELELLDSKAFLVQFVSGILSALNGLRKVIVESKLFKLFNVRMFNIESKLQSFYDNHQDIIESEQEDKTDTAQVSTQLQTKSPYQNTEDDFRGILSLRYEQSNQKSVEEFLPLIQPFLSQDLSVKGISSSMKKVYISIAQFIRSRNLLLMGNQSLKENLRQQLKAFYPSIASAFRLETSEFREPGRGNFIYLFLGKMIEQIKEISKGDSKDNVHLSSDLKKTEELFTSVRNSIKEINSEVAKADVTKQLKEKDNDKNKKEEDKKKKTFTDIFEPLKSDDKQQFLRAKEDFEVDYGGNKKNINSGEKIILKIENKNLKSVKDWQKIFKEIKVKSEGKDNKKMFDVNSIQWKIDETKEDIKCYDEEGKRIQRIFYTIS